MTDGTQGKGDVEKLNICFKDKVAKDVFLPLRPPLLKVYPAMNLFFCLILILFSVIGHNLLPMLSSDGACLQSLTHSFNLLRAFLKELEKTSRP